MKRHAGLRSILLASAAIFAALGARGQQSSSSGQGSLGVSIVSAVSVQKSQDLILGEFRPGQSPGTVDLNVVEGSGFPSRTSSGGVALSGSTFSPAEFSVSTHASGPVHFAVLLPSGITLERVGGGESMRVDGFRSGLRRSCLDGSSAESCAGSPYTLLVGATLHVGAGQRAGHYVGTFTITVNQL